jgi:hypothetical protein
MYDYWLGGKDNFPADREMAEWVLTLTPETLDTVRANRQWMVRAIQFLCDAGIRQFLDIGAGLPTSPNTYEVAQAAAPEARVVSVKTTRCYCSTPRDCRRRTAPFGSSKRICVTWPRSWPGPGRGTA